jgi:hypothetical protein
VGRAKPASPKHGHFDLAQSRTGPLADRPCLGLGADPSYRPEHGPVRHHVWPVLVSEVQSDN